MDDSLLDGLASRQVQSHICRTFRLTLFPAIQPRHASYSPSPTPFPSTAGHEARYSGHVPLTICGTPCHAKRLGPDMYTALPLRSLSVMIFSCTSPSSPRSVEESPGAD